jgi:DNA (cytosine-5)-methyltransferase 1
MSEWSPALNRHQPSDTSHRVQLVSQNASVRRLTPTECERLQGLPDGWTTPGPDSRRYAGLGDAVTSPVGKWIGRRLVAA